jgi:hypothetical protein
MLMIPNYPYYVTFFYTTMGLFFVCLTGRENHDIEYSMALPIRKRDIVKARVAFAVVIEVVQALVAIPFALLRQRVIPGGNAVGMDANVAFFGLSFLMLGLFHLLFFPRYYRNPDKVGSSFVIGSTAVFLYVAVAETLCHAAPLFRDMLDTPDPQFLGAKLAVLAAGLTGYALATWITYRVSARRFEALDV